VTCYESLIPYACTFQTNHVKLARAAADANLAWLRGFSKHVKEVAVRASGAGGVEAAALRDCAGTVSSAADLGKQSAAELAQLDASGGVAAGRKKVRWSISNAQTWLSAAMTNEATCADGIGVVGAAMSPAAREVVIGVVSAKERTSIALALVNGIPVPS
jgi:pectinesterase inhibitor-like protein